MNSSFNNFPNSLVYNFQDFEKEAENGFRDFSEKKGQRENARARVSIAARVAARRLRTSSESGGLRVARVAGERVH